jgi:hypothetical protein
VLRDLTLCSAIEMSVSVCAVTHRRIVTLSYFRRIVFRGDTTCSSSPSTVTGRPRDLGSIPSSCMGKLSFCQRPDRLSMPTSFLPNAVTAISAVSSWPGREVDPLTSF